MTRFAGTKAIAPARTDVRYVELQRLPEGRRWFPVGEHLRKLDRRIIREIAPVSGY
jgi:hypothetical protein